MTDTTQIPAAADPEAPGAGPATVAAGSGARNPERETAAAEHLGAAQSTAVASDPVWPGVDGTSVPAGRSLDLLHGVEMTVTVELGRTKMLLRDLLGLQTGSIIELDRPTGSPVDVLINDRLLARGEVVVVDDEFGVRILDIISGDVPSSNR